MVISVVEDSSISDDVSDGALTVKVEGDADCCEDVGRCCASVDGVDVSTIDVS